MNRISNFSELQEAAKNVPREAYNAVVVRAAIRNLTATKRFLDQPDSFENQEFALAPFHDLMRAAVKSVFPDARVWPHSTARNVIEGTLKLLAENDEQFGYSYAAAALALDAQFVRSFDVPDTLSYSSKSLELAARNSLPNRALIFLPIQIDLSVAASTGSAVAVYSSHELTPGGGLPGEPRYQPYDLDLALKNAGPEWGYVRDWYKGFLRGRPIDWDIQRKVAELPIEFASQGIRVFESAVQKIQDASMAASAALLPREYPIAEDVFYNEATARFGRAPRAVKHLERHEAVLISVRDAVGAASTGNYLHAGEYHIRTLSHMLETNSKHPHVIEQKLVQVARSLRREMAKPDGLPDAPEIEALAEACDENALEMRTLYPEVAKARAEKGAQRVREASAKERQALGDLKEVIEQITEAEFGAEIADDIDAIRETSALAEDGRGEVDADAVGRTGNRLAKIWLLTKKLVRGTAIAGGTVIVGAEGIAAINEALPILLRLLGL